MSTEDTTAEKEKSLNFIEQRIENDLSIGKNEGRVHTRFPPEPNGYLHIGHAKSICLNFSVAEKYKGLTNLRFDDTNPAKEETEYVNAIREDVHWLGYDWEEREFYASDYFQPLYDYAIELIKLGKAFVCDLSQEEIAAMRGTPTEPGQESPYRNRSVEENLDLFKKMKAGEFEEGSKILRAKIDMASPNMHMRDPAIYRIKKAHHHRTGDEWNIYPMYDYAHCMSDSIEGITHSLCTLEFEVHRPLYDWFVETLGLYHPQQIEFARLNVNYTVTSKRKLLELVEGNYVDGWDDPRMTTISGLRRRGFTPKSIREFCDKVGVAKRDNIIDMQLLDFTLREDLNKIAQRRFAVLDPVKVVITNYPEGGVELVNAVNNPEDENAGTRELPFGREIYIEREDFMENPPPPKKFFRMGPERFVRLKYAYIVQCTGFVKDENGLVQEIHCEYYPESKSGQDTSGIKAKGTLHWLNADGAEKAEVRLYDRLFSVEDPVGEAGEEKDWKDFINPDSLSIVSDALVEKSLVEAQVGEHFQFERKGYFTVDSKYSGPGAPVFNRTATLKDGWAKAQKK